MTLLPTTIHKVRIVCRTFNQAQYIIDALNGFCMQKTNFPFVAIIIDDASTDGEPQIISQYLEDHFDMANAQNDENDDAKRIAAVHKDNPNCHFLVILLKYNFYSIKKAVYPLYKGWHENVPYIAMCEGDDFWTNSLKLQKQVDYLEGHPKCGLVWAKAKCYYQNKGEFKGTTGHYMSGYYDMFVNYSIAPLTTMYRRTAVEGYSDFIKGQKWLLGDAPLYLYIAHDHDIYFMDEIVGVYRILKNSASHHTSYEQKIRFKNSTFDVVKFFCEKYGHPNFKQLESIHYSYMFNYAFNDARYDTAKEFYDLIPYPTLKIRMKRFVISSRLLRNCYQYIYNRITK